MGTLNIFHSICNLVRLFKTSEFWTPQTPPPGTPLLYIITIYFLIAWNLLQQRQVVIIIFLHHSLCMKYNHSTIYTVRT